MQNRGAGTAFVSLLLAAATATAQTGITPPDPPSHAEAALLPADAVMVMSFDVRGLFASRMFSDLMAGKVPALAGVEPAAEAAQQAREQMTKSMDEIEAEIGLRVDRDVERVTMAMANPDAPSPDLLIVVTGTFDPPRILAAMEASEKKKGRTISTRKIDGVSVQWTEASEGKSEPAVAFPTSGLMLVGEMGRVESAIRAHRAAAAAPAGLAARLPQARPGAGAVMLVGEQLFEKMKEQRPGATPPPFPLPLRLMIASEFDGVTEMTADLATPQEASNMVDVVKGGLAMFRMQVAQNPDMQKVPALQEVMNGIDVTADGTKVRLTSTPGQGFGAGVLAAIAIPSLLRARVSANEAATIGDVRTVISAQMAYEATTGGFGDLPCLAAPAECVDGYEGPVFLDAALTGGHEKSGYRRAFHAGPRGDRPHSVKAWAYTAVPIEPGNTGVRSFCGDASGVVRADASGGDIAPVAGVCPDSLTPLQ